MIATKKDLRFYIVSDRIMNGFPRKRTLTELLREVVDLPVNCMIINYLQAMRHYAYYKNTNQGKLGLRCILMLYWHRKWNRLSLKLGYSIGPNSLGYGVVLPHHGTIVVNENAHVGNFAVLHTSTCIAGGDKEIGDFFYLSSGSQIVGKVNLGEGVSVAAHSLVNKSFGDNVLLAGCPATVKRENYQPWYIRDGNEFIKRYENVLHLKKEIYG